MNLPDDVLINEILPNISLNDLAKLCQSDVRLRNLCQSESLWQNKMKLDFPNVSKPTPLTFKQFYMFLIQADRVPVYRHGDIVMNTLVTVNNRDYAINDIKNKLNGPASLIFIGAGCGRDFFIDGVASTHNNEYLGIFNVEKITYILIVDGNIFESDDDIERKVKDYIKTDLLSTQSKIPIYGFISGKQLYIIDQSFPIRVSTKIQYTAFQRIAWHPKYILGVKLGLIRYLGEPVTEQMVIDKLKHVGHLFDEGIMYVN